MHTGLLTLSLYGVLRMSRLVDAMKKHENYADLEPFEPVRGVYHKDLFGGWFHHMIVPQLDDAIILHLTARQSWNAEMAEALATRLVRADVTLPDEASGFIVWHDIDLGHPHFDAILITHPTVAARFKDDPELRGRHLRRLSSVPVRVQ